jgi:hypothetical protein
MKAFDLKKRVELGHINESEAREEGVKFSLFRAELTLKNLNLTEENPSLNSRNPTF